MDALIAFWKTSPPEFQATVVLAPGIALGLFGPPEPWLLQAVLGLCGLGACAGFLFLFHPPKE